jgi:hypothetical protein
MKVYTDAFVSKIGTRIAGKDDSEAMKVVDIVFILGLIATVIPKLIQCFQPASGQRVGIYLTRHYKNGRYTPAVLKATTLQVKQDAEKDGGLLDYSVAEECALGILDQARESEAYELTSIIKEHKKAA